VNVILGIPLGLRLTWLFALGALTGGLVNLAVYRLAFHKRSLSPWSAAPTGVPRRRATDRLPIVGWWALRRETFVQGRGFWIRPLAVEVFTGLLFAALYLVEVEWNVPQWGMPNGLPAAALLNPNWQLVLHMRYLAHLTLISLMLAASLIDYDEQMIPDAITLVGTMVGLAWAACYPWSLPWAGDWLVDGARETEFLSLVSPEPWTPVLGGLPLWQPLAVALACWTFWCAAIAPRYWNVSRGLTMAVRVLIHRLRAESMTRVVLALWLGGLAVIILAAWLAPDAHWAGLSSSLVGVLAGACMIWAVRIVGGAALAREAMGFGEVTLLAMIGALLGWQGVIVVFFLAPFAGAVIGILQFVVRGEHEVPYGPFLCLAALVVLIQWPDIWQRTEGIFAMAGILVALLAACMALMGLVLWAYRVTRDRWARS
jgi:leader peptidase (prepilin peptidase) / N-methyltransferase